MIENLKLFEQVSRHQRQEEKFELKKEFVDGFYEHIFPLIQEDMFIKAEREEIREKQLSLFAV